MGVHEGRGKPMTEEAEGRVAELESELQEERQRALRAERSLAKLQTSLPMSVGQLVIEAGTNPRRLPRLPFDLLRIRRQRRRSREGRIVSDRDGAIQGRNRATKPKEALRLLVPRRVLTVDDRPSVLVIAPDVTVDRLERSAHVSRALPHDAGTLMETLDADLVVVDARVGELGSPWFPLGQPGEGRREQSLLALRGVCEQLGRPLVLVFDPTTSPGLIDFAHDCDVVIDPDEWDGHVDPATLLKERCSLSTRVASGDGDA